MLPHFSKVPTRFVCEVTFNTERQSYEFMDRPGTELDMSVINIMKTTINGTILWIQVNLNQYLFTFPFDTKLVLCRDRHLQILSLKIPISEEKNSPSNTIKTHISVHKEYNYSEDEVHTST